MEAETTEKDAYSGRARRESGIKPWNRGHPAWKPAGRQRKPCSGELNGFPHCAQQQKEKRSSVGFFPPYHSPLIQLPPISFDFKFLPLACICPQCTHITYPTLGQGTCKYMAAIVLWQSVVPLTRTGATVLLKCAINWHLWQWRPSVLLEKGADVWDIQRRMCWCMHIRSRYCHVRDLSKVLACQMAVVSKSYP